jgi:hypothetical protein
MPVVFTVFAFFFFSFFLSWAALLSKGPQESSQHHSLQARRIESSQYYSVKARRIESSQQYSVKARRIKKCKEIGNGSIVAITDLETSNSTLNPRNRDISFVNNAFKLQKHKAKAPTRSAKKQPI